jgi:methylmalonyl-CoA mutase cobalamin-binding subunit
MLKQMNAKDLSKMESTEELESLISKLSAKEKAELMQKLLGQSGLMVVLGGSNVTTSEIVIQIHSNSAVDLSELLRAIAQRITTQPDSLRQQGQKDSSETNGN